MRMRETRSASDPRHLPRNELCPLDSKGADVASSRGAPIEPRSCRPANMRCDQLPPPSSGWTPVANCRSALTPFGKTIGTTDSSSNSLRTVAPSAANLVPLDSRLLQILHLAEALNRCWVQSTGFYDGHCDRSPAGGHRCGDQRCCAGTEDRASQTQPKR